MWKFLNKMCVFVGEVGTVMAMIVSWDRNESIWYAFWHGMCGWLYIVWFAIWGG